MAEERARDYEIAVVGDSGSIAGFAGLGLRTFPVSLDTDVNSLLRELVGPRGSAGEFAIIYLTEQVAEQCQGFLAERANSYLPAIITIPSAATTEAGSSLQHLQDMVRAAVGIDVIQNLPDEQETEEERDG